MTDLSKSRPLIGVYDEAERSVTVHQLEPEEPGQAEVEVGAQKLKFDTREVGGYGRFKPIYKIENFRMTHHDVMRESGREDFIYMARENAIYKLYIDENALR